MTTSGVTNFSLNRLEICTRAAELAGRAGQGKDLDDYILRKMSDSLNMMLAHWNKSGPHLWKIDEGVLFLQPYQNKYKLGNASTDDYACAKDDLVITQLNGSLADNATALTVDSTTGMTVGDYIGVVMSTKYVHWTTIATIPTSTTLTLTSGVTETCNDNAYVYTFTNKIYKPQDILKKTVKCMTGVNAGATSTLQSNPMVSFGYADMQSFIDVDQASATTLSGYNYLPQNINGLLYTYPTPNDGAYRVHFSYKKQLEDMVDTTDTADMPKEWLEAIIYQLALRECVDKSERFQNIAALATSMLEDLKAASQSFGDIQLTPRNRRW